MRIFIFEFTWPLQPSLVLFVAFLLRPAGKSDRSTAADADGPVTGNGGPFACPRRGAGVVERGGLENRCGRKSTEGSNPSLSAIPPQFKSSLRLRHPMILLVFVG